MRLVRTRVGILSKQQDVHRIDIMNWVMGGPPAKVVAMGGQQVRTDHNRYGHVWDHFGVQFEYPNGVIISSYSRQEQGTEAWSRVSEHFIGTKGEANPSGSIKAASTYKYEGPTPNPSSAPRFPARRR